MSQVPGLATPEAVFVCEGGGSLSPDTTTDPGEANPFEGVTQIRMGATSSALNETSGLEVPQVCVSQNSIIDFVPLSGVLAHPDETSQLRRDASISTEAEKLSLPEDSPGNVHDNEEHTTAACDEVCSPITPQSFPPTQFLTGFESEFYHLSSDEASQASGMDAKGPSSVSRNEIPANQRSTGNTLCNAEQDIDDGIQINESAQIVPGRDVLPTDLLPNTVGKICSTQDSGKHRDCQFP